MERKKFLKPGRKKHNGGCEGNSCKRVTGKKPREYVGKKNPQECLSESVLLSSLHLIPFLMDSIAC